MNHQSFWIAFLLITLFFIPLRGMAQVTQPFADQNPPLQAQEAVTNPVRRVNVPYFSGDVDLSQAAIFWFGQNKQGVPSQNYIDIRMGYSPTGLQVTATIIDYYLWYQENATAEDDLSKYDALAVYIDTHHDRNATPQSDDFYFLVGARDWPNEDAPVYRRQARGNGSGWNAGWNTTWHDLSIMEWNCNPGPNSNECDIDYGWVGGITIPWNVIGLSGAPAQGTLWGLGVTLYDRDDQPPNGYVSPEYWPESFDANNPSSWGEIHFGDSQYQPAPAIPSGSTMIRASTPEDNVVEDSWMGGGGECSSGHNGGSEINYGDSQNLFVGSEIAATHFPCYNKSYLRFRLGGIPAGKTIISATLTLHHWGNAGDPNAPNDEDRGHDSYVWLFNVIDPWGEMTIHWNNSPIAQENLDVVRITSIPDFQGWPGVAYSWDATKAVADAYAAGQPVNLAIYDSSTQRNTSKYLTASETGLNDGTPNWNIAGRPRLVVVWGGATAVLQKTANPARAANGATVTYTLSWSGTSQALSLTDTLPQGLSAPSITQPAVGTASYNPSTRQITWTGTPTAGQAVQLTYQCSVQSTNTLMLTNTALLNDGGTSTSASAKLCINCPVIYLPLVIRSVN